MCSSQMGCCMPVIPSTAEAETGRMMVHGQPGQKVNETQARCGGAYVQSQLCWEGIGRRIMV